MAWIRHGELFGSIISVDRGDKCFEFVSL